MSDAQKFIAIPTIGIYLRANQSKESLPYNFLINLRILCIQISMQQLHDPVSLKPGACNKTAVLQIYLILLIIIMIREFSITGKRQTAFIFRTIYCRNAPDLIGFSFRHIITCFGEYMMIFRLKHRISHTMTATAFIILLILSNRFPGSGPKIPILIIPDINVTARLIETIEIVAKNTTIGTGFSETVAARIIGNQCTILR